MLENQQYDKKSIAFLKGKNTNWDELAKDAVCFANASGGKILLGIEDDDEEPPVGQTIEDRTIAEKL